MFAVVHRKNFWLRIRREDTIRWGMQSPHPPPSDHWMASLLLIAWHECEWFSFLARADCMTPHCPRGSFSIFIVAQKLRLALLLTPTAATTTISTTCLNSRTWESTSGSRRRGGGGVACHFAVPASMSQTLFPLGIHWTMRPCSGQHTYYVGNKYCVWEGYTAASCAHSSAQGRGKKKIFSHRSIWRCE